MTPLVSVMIPTYNSRATLPLALASLVVQTYPHWECIVVDDGSTDDTADLMAVVQEADSRIHYIRLNENRGRGATRQIALDNVQGQYLAMIDADDWVYPSKLEQQVEVMQAHPELALVSAGMAIVDANHNLLGFRVVHEQQLRTYPPLHRPQFPMVAHAPSMIRMDVARAAGYDSRFRRTEDVDFLMRVMMKQPYGTLGKPLYAYAEHYSLNWQAIASSYFNTIRTYSKYLFHFPLDSLKTIGVTLGKLLMATGMGIVGLSSLHERLRPLRSPSLTQQEEFDNARQLVLSQITDLSRINSRHAALSLAATPRS